MSPLSSSLSAVALLSLALSVAGQKTNSQAPSLDNLASRYPPTGQIANILPNDDEANALFKKMSSDPQMQKILRVNPKGSADGTGNFKGYNYDGSSDPDCWWTWSQCMTPKAPGLVPDISTCNEASTWGLTFDDGPAPTQIQGKLLDFLDQNKQKATFFLIGANILNNPDAAQDIFNRGHEVCGHTWSHHYSTSLSDASVFAEIYYTKKIIKEVVGVTTRCWRAPYGDIDDRVRAIAAYLDSRTVLWDQDTDDWSIDDGASPATIQANFAKIIADVAKTGHGTIVLDHSISDKLVDMFISQYPKISAAFKNVMPALSCANWTSPYYETNVTYPDFAAYSGGNHGSDQNASVSLDLNGGQLLFGNVSDQLAVPAPASSSSAPAPAALPSGAGAGAGAGAGNSTKSTGGNTGAASHVAVWSFSALVAAALGSLVVAA